jgi:hypothetical protein
MTFLASPYAIMIIAAFNVSTGEPEPTEVLAKIRTMPMCLSMVDGIAEAQGRVYRAQGKEVSLKVICAPLSKSQVLNLGKSALEEIGLSIGWESAPRP